MAFLTKLQLKQQMGRLRVAVERRETKIKLLLQSLKWHVRKLNQCTYGKTRNRGEYTWRLGRGIYGNVRLYIGELKNMRKN